MRSRRDLASKLVVLAAMGGGKLRGGCRREPVSWIPTGPGFTLGGHTACMDHGPPRSSHLFISRLARFGAGACARRGLLKIYGSPLLTLLTRRCEGAMQKSLRWLHIGRRRELLHRQKKEKRITERMEQLAVWRRRCTASREYAPPFPAGRARQDAGKSGGKISRRIHGSGSYSRATAMASNQTDLVTANAIFKRALHRLQSPVISSRERKCSLVVKNFGSA